ALPIFASPCRKERPFGTGGEFVGRRARDRDQLPRRRAAVLFATLQAIAQLAVGEADGLVLAAEGRSARILAKALLEKRHRCDAVAVDQPFAAVLQDFPEQPCARLG